MMTSLNLQEEEKLELLLQTIAMVLIVKSGKASPDAKWKIAKEDIKNILNY
jgi:hypothetical protein